MKYTDLGFGGAKASVLGFGCAAVMGRVGRRESLRALGAAYDKGITFFDTARSYGYGESEAILGEFLDGRRDRVILSTKFGIVPLRQPRWKHALKPMVRTIISVVPLARRVIRNQVKAQFKADQLTTSVLRSSLEESLRKLRTDYIDILFMHSAPASVLAQRDLLDELQKLVVSGKVRMIGISADPDVIATALQVQDPLLRAMQFPVNLSDFSLLPHIGAAENRGLTFVANHPFGGMEGIGQSRARLLELQASPGISSDLRDKLRSKDDGILAETVLNLILTDTGIQIVVPSMMKARHLRANIKAISDCRFTAQELSWIRRNMPQVSRAGRTEVRLSA